MQCNTVELTLVLSPAFTSKTSSDTHTAQSSRTVKDIHSTTRREAWVRRDTGGAGRVGFADRSKKGDLYAWSVCKGASRVCHCILPRCSISIRPPREITISHDTIHIPGDGALTYQHIGSNATTNFRPNPSPREIADSPALIQRATTFLRRELRVWSDTSRVTSSPIISSRAGGPTRRTSHGASNGIGGGSGSGSRVAGGVCGVEGGVDVEYLTMYVISLLKAIDIRSEPAIRLLADFLEPNRSTLHTATPRVDDPASPLASIASAVDSAPNTAPRANGNGIGHGTGNGNGAGVKGFDYPNAAEHFAHELHTFLRSPFKELWKWDEIVQVSRTLPLTTSIASCSHWNRFEEAYTDVQYDPIPSDTSRPTSPARPVETASIPPRSVARSKSPSRSLSPLSDYSSFRSDSYSDRSYSRSPPRQRYRSPSRSPLPRLSPRDPTRRDTFIAPPSPGARRWDQADSWVDPEYAAWVEDERRREQERRERKRQRITPKPKPLRERIELLPSPPGRALFMDGVPTSPRRATLPAVPAVKEIEPTVLQESSLTNGPIISIRGAAAVPIKLSLAERLAKAKAEAASQKAQPETSPTLPDATTPPPAPPLLHSTSDTAQTTMSQPGVRAAVQARLKLRLKLASERKSLLFNLNESRAQILRAQILEAKAAREAEETDQVLRAMDRVDRAREVRRRLMVLKMMDAETESEKRARELKERLVKDKRARVLREQLVNRKKSLSGGGVVQEKVVVVEA